MLYNLLFPPFRSSSFYPITTYVDRKYLYSHTKLQKRKINTDKLSHLFTIYDTLEQVSCYGVHNADASSTEYTIPFAVGGGTARDLYFNRRFSDVDIVYHAENKSDPDTAFYQAYLRYRSLAVNYNPYLTIFNDYNAMYRFSLLNRGNPDEMLIDFIHVADDSLHPYQFDYTINLMQWRGDDHLYAPGFTWNDIDKQQIALNHIEQYYAGKRRLTSNVFFRGLRFASQYEFTIEPYTLLLFMQNIPRLQDAIDQHRLLKTVDKMVAEDKNRFFEWLRLLGFLRSRNIFPHIEQTDPISTFDEFLSVARQSLSRGSYIDEATGYKDEHEEHGIELDNIPF